MLTNILGYPRMGAHRELKRAVEAYRKGLIDRDSSFRQPLKSAKRIGNL